MIGPNTKLSSVLWADDLIMISESKDGLTKMLSDLVKFSAENGLKINADKTKCMIFNKTGRYIRCNIKIDELVITSVREYKYLGFLMTPSGEVSTGIQDLRSRASYALVQLRNRLNHNFRQNIGISLYLFDTLVKPILLYCSDFWGILKINKRDPSDILPKSNFLDLVHMKFLKQLLGVQIQTSNIGVLLETGRVPLMAYAVKNCVKNWYRIAIDKNCNPLTYASFENIVNQELGWHENMKSLFNHTGLGYLMNGDINNPETEVFRRIVDIFHQKSLAEIATENSKLRTYSLFKREIREEPYLRKVKNVKDRISMTKLRLSNHKLMIEKGRHLNLGINERICPFCPSIEDEGHFILKCHVYNELRNDLINYMKEKLNIGPQIVNDTNQMLKYALGNTEIAPIVAKYLTRTLEIRDFLIEKPRLLS